MKVLLIGGSGQVGIELQRLTWPEGTELTAPGRTILDLINPKNISQYFEKFYFDIVINAGGYTAVDQAQREPVAAFATNALGACAIAESTRHAGISLIHISTDYVFDGRKEGFYQEDDLVCPLNVYGASKAAAENAVRTVNPRAIIVRTAWLVSPHRANFAKTILRLAKERPRLRVVSDQHGSPTAARDLAEALGRIALVLKNQSDIRGGIYHFVNAGETTWHGLAEAILQRAAMYGLAAPPVDAIKTSEYPTPALRPANSRLSTGRLEREFAIVPRSWKAAVDETIDELILRGPHERYHSGRRVGDSALSSDLGNQ
jgi:dTDP-4-dehydrorhamnose reductase